MKKTRILTAIAAASALLLSHPALALPNTQDTRMLSEPAVSSRHIAFIYAGDLWLSNLDGGGARRLTSDLGDKSNPVFSPDGSLIAYFSDESGEYELHVRAQDGKGAVRKFKFNGSGFYDNAVWSPDSRKIAFADTLWRRHDDAVRLDPGAARHADRRDGRFGRRPAAVDVPQK